MWDRGHLEALAINVRMCMYVCEYRHTPVSAVSHPLAFDTTKLSMRWIELWCQCNVRVDPFTFCDASLFCDVHFIGSFSANWSPTPTCENSMVSWLPPIPLLQSVTSDIFINNFILSSMHRQRCLRQHLGSYTRLTTRLTTRGNIAKKVRLWVLI